jgi:hypothetical protein
MRRQLTIGRVLPIRLSLLILLVFILLWGIHAQAPEGQGGDKHWTKLPVVNPVLVKFAQIDFDDPKRPEDFKLGEDLIVVSEPAAEGKYATVFGFLGIWNGRFWKPKLKIKVKTEAGEEEIEMVAHEMAMKIEDVPAGEDRAPDGKGARTTLADFYGKNFKTTAELECGGQRWFLTFNKETPSYGFLFLPSLLSSSPAPLPPRQPVLLNWKQFDVPPEPEGRAPYWERNAKIVQFPSDITSIAVADFNHDGNYDLAVTSGDGMMLYIMQGDGKCNFLTPAIVTENEEREAANELIEREGGKGKELYPMLLQDLYENRKFALQEFPFNFDEYPSAVVAGDFNRDGAKDVAIGVAGTAGGYISIYINRGQDGLLEPLLRADGTPEKYRAAKAEEEKRLLLITGRFTDDRNLDLVAAGEKEIVLLPGRGDATFEERQRIGDANFPRALIAEDFNGDGYLDLAVANLDRVDIWLGDGKGNFQEPEFDEKEGAGTRIVVGEELSALAAKNLDLDGDLDLVVASKGTNEMIVLLNQDGRFVHLRRPRIGLTLETLDLVGKTSGTLTALGATSSTTGDFNGDDIDDITVAYSQVETKLDVEVKDKNFKKVKKVTIRYLGRVNMFLGSKDKKLSMKSIDIKDRNVTEYYPASLNSGDFNRDEKDDLVVGNLGKQEELSSPRGKSSVLCFITDQRKCEYPLAGSESLAHWEFPDDAKPHAVGLGDFDKDGDLDLAVTAYYYHDADCRTDYDPGRVYILKRDRNGVFKLAEYSWYQVGIQPVAIAVADFNGDGFDDIATADFGSNTITILLNSGRRTFIMPPITIPVGTMPIDIAVEDFDGKNGPDIAVANFGSDDVSILLNNGDGTFEVSRKDVGKGPIAIAVGYRDGASLNELIGEEEEDDGIPDLVVANFVSNDLNLMLGRIEDGTFTFEKRTMAEITQEIRNVNRDRCEECKEDGVLKRLPNGPIGVEVGDFDGDGSLDVAVAVEFPEKPLGDGWQDVYIIYGENSIGTGIDTKVACKNPNAVTIGNFDAGEEQDEGPDLAVTCGTDDKVSIILNRGGRKFESVVNLQYEVGKGPTGIIAGDFKEDGDPDLIVPNPGSNDVSVLIGKEGAGFDRQDDIPIGVVPIAIARADFNGDGHEDVAVAHQGSSDIWVLFGDGVGNFPNQVKITPRARGSPADISLTAIVAADFDGEKGPDLAVADDENNVVLIFLNEGDGNFSQAPEEHQVGRWPTSIAAADLDGDGDQDSVVISHGSAEISILINDGGGKFSARQIAVGRDPWAIAIADFDGEKGPDLAVTDRGLNVIWVFLNAGGGSFPEGEMIPVGMGEDPIAIASGDVDKDGNQDLVVINSGSHEVHILY